jgi:hypothetical protein
MQWGRAGAEAGAGSVAHLRTDAQRSGQMSVCFFALSADTPGPGREAVLTWRKSMAALCPTLPVRQCHNSRDECCARDDPDT